MIDRIVRGSIPRIAARANSLTRCIGANAGQPSPINLLPMTPILQIILISICAVFLIASVIAVAIDERKRNRSALLVGSLCLITWPLGPMLWLMRRPPPVLKA
jgi:uncharacterized membrane protein